MSYVLVSGKDVPHTTLHTKLLQVYYSSAAKERRLYFDNIKTICRVVRRWEHAEAKAMVREGLAIRFCRHLSDVGARTSGYVDT